MLNFYDFIQDYVFSTNHHLKAENLQNVALHSRLYSRRTNNYPQWLLFLLSYFQFLFAMTIIKYREGLNVHIC